MSNGALTARIVAAKAKLDEIHAEVQLIAEAADMHDADSLSEAEEAILREVIDSLADVNRAIVAVDDPFESAEWNARKLEL